QVGEAPGEHHELEEVARHPTTIERRMDPDQSILNGVAPELDRLSFLLLRRARATSPRDERVHRAAEIFLVEALVDREKIVVLSLRRQSNLRRRTAREPRVILLDVVADERARF